jgi:predicted ATPase
MSVRLRVENYRVLRKIDWDLPKGVCALVGPNGSGKTTLLDVPVLLRDLVFQTYGGAFARHGTHEGLVNLQAPPGAVVTLGVDSDSVTWNVEVAFDQGRARFSETFPGSDPQAWLPEDADTLFPSVMVDSVVLIDHFPFLKYRLYSDYRLADIRRKGSLPSASTRLAEDGTNVFSVLRNWAGKKHLNARFEFVIDSLKEAFPDTFDALDFDPADDGTVSARILSPRGGAALPVLYAPSGWITALLHLTAIASTETGGIVAIDEPENGLHPHAIRQILQAIRGWAADHDLTVLLATHSPVLLDQFKEDPEHLFVMEPGREVLPVRLDQVRDREWLAQFSLGDLYKGGDFGAPTEGAAA